MATLETKPLDLRALPLDMFLSERHAAASIGMTGAYLRKLRHKGSELKFCQLGKRKIRYRVRDLLAWLDSLPTFTNMEAQHPAVPVPARRKLKGKPEARAGAR